MRRGVNGVMDAGIEATAITGNVVGRSIYGIGYGTYHLARGLMNKHL